MDTATATTIESLRAEVEAYQALYDNACVQVADLRAENERIISLATMDREEIDSMGKRNDELRAALDATRADMVRLTEQLEYQTVLANARKESGEETRRAWDRERARASVLEAAVNAAIQCGLTNSSWAHITSPPEVAERCGCPPCTMKILKHALDAGKFRVGP